MTLNWQNSTSLVAVRNTAPRALSEHYADVRCRLGVDCRRPNGAPVAPVVPVAVIAAPEITPAPKQPPPSPPEWVSDLKFVQRLVAHEFDLTPTELFYRSRAWRFLRARQVAQYLMHSVLKRSLTCVGAFFDCDHTTVLNSSRKIEALIAEPGHADFAERVARLEQIVLSRAKSASVGQGD